MCKTTKSISRVLALFGLIATLAPLSVFAQSRLDIDIPFDFTVGPKTFNAGAYHISELTPYTLVVQSGNYRTSTIIEAVTDVVATALPNLATLTFNSYGDRYFLSKVAIPSRGWDLPPSRTEKALVAHSRSPKRISVVASLRR